LWPGPGPARAAHLPPAARAWLAGRSAEPVAWDAAPVEPAIAGVAHAVVTVVALVAEPRPEPGSLA